MAQFEGVREWKFCEVRPREARKELEKCYSGYLELVSMGFSSSSGAFSLASFSLMSSHLQWFQYAFYISWFVPYFGGFFCTVTYFFLAYFRRIVLVWFTVLFSHIVYDSFNKINKKKNIILSYDIERWNENTWVYLSQSMILVPSGYDLSISHIF